MKVTLVQVSTMFEAIDKYCDETYHEGCTVDGQCIFTECLDYLDNIELDIKDDDFAKLKSADEHVRKEHKYASNSITSDYDA